MLQQDASATRPYRRLVFETRALAVSKLGCTNLIFVEPGAKISGQYYRDVLLMQLRSIAGGMFAFQQGRSAHVLVTQLSYCEVRHRSSSVLTCGQPTVLTSTQ